MFFPFILIKITIIKQSTLSPFLFLAQTHNPGALMSHQENPDWRLQPGLCATSIFWTHIWTHIRTYAHILPSLPQQDKTSDLFLHPQAWMDTLSLSRERSFPLIDIHAVSPFVRFKWYLYLKSISLAKERLSICQDFWEKGTFTPVGIWIFDRKKKKSWCIFS